MEKVARFVGWVVIALVLISIFEVLLTVAVQIVSVIISTITGFANTIAQSVKSVFTKKQI